MSSRGCLASPSSQNNEVSSIRDLPRAATLRTPVPELPCGLGDGRVAAEKGLRGEGGTQEAHKA